VKRRAHLILGAVVKGYCPAVNITNATVGCPDGTRFVLAVACTQLQPELMIAVQFCGVRASLRARLLPCQRPLRPAL
jgi:hypothetical protein